ncbi:hypothetical protein [Agromyces allii]|uniref:Uncharacterized protein n=1 Tax=Agromyces allii TaxID=393607 RepID=A0ABP5CA92_9MICO|nr:hypothetical protein [Agromyces allii]
MSGTDGVDTEAQIEQRYPRPRRPGFLASAAITLLVLGVGFAVFGYSPAVLVTLYGGMLAAYAAIPYTLTAIVVREVVARRGRGEDEEPNDEAVRFGLFRQRASFVTAIAMLVAITVLVVGAIVDASGAYDPFGPAGSGPFGGGLASFGAFAFFAGGFAIVVNVPSIYSASVVRSERHAVRQRVGAWRVIRANTILTTASWIAYCGFGVFFITQTFWS